MPAAIKVSRRGSPLRSVFIVLCVLVALMVLIVGGLVAWTQLRPVGAGDYRKAGNDATALTEDLTPIVTRQSQMMDLSLLPTPEQIERAAQSQRDQLATFRTGVDELGDLHGMRDPELKKLQEQLLTTTDDRLSPMVEDFVTHYAAVMQMQQICSEYDKNEPTRPVDGADQAWFDGKIEQCEQATKEAAKSTVFTPFVDVRQKHITDSRAAYQEYGEATTDDARLAAQSKIGKAQAGIETRGKEGLRKVAEANDAVFAEVTAGIDAITTYTDQQQ